MEALKAPGYPASAGYDAPPRAEAPAQAAARLRIGVFAVSPMQPRWRVDAVGSVAASGCASMTVFALGLESPEAAPPLWDMYGWLDRRWFGAGADTTEPVDLPSTVAHEERMGLPAPQTAAAWREKVASLGLDVALALDDIDDRLLEGVARFGVWRFCAGDDAAGMDPLAGSREVAEGAPLTTTGVKVRFADGVERLVYASAARTHAFSAARNRDEVLRKSAQFMVRALRELHRSGAGWLERCPECRTAAPRLPPDLRRAAWDVLNLGARVGLRSLQRLLTIDQWSLAFKFGELREGWSDLQGFTRLVPPPDRFWADPFPVTVAGRHFIFFEEMLFDKGKAHISVIEVGRDGTRSKPQRVLERDYHLSYPFLLQHEGVLYMIPESSENRTVELYRCTVFPTRWRLEKTLLRGIRCADATLHHDGERWWMFAGAAGEGAALDDELHLFYADRLEGEWRPHERNPVKSDVRASRPAGALYAGDGGLLRPAQVCAPRYGAGISIQRVLRLTTADYVEREAHRIVPASADRLLGIHTFNRAGDLTVVDGFARRLRNPLFPGQ